MDNPFLSEKPETISPPNFYEEDNMQEVTRVQRYPD